MLCFVSVVKMSVIYQKIQYKRKNFLKRLQ